MGLRVKLNANQAGMNRNLACKIPIQLGRNGRRKCICGKT